MEKFSCPICRSDQTSQFLQRNEVPVHQNLILADLKSAIAAPRGDLALFFCEDCGFVWNKLFDISKLSYGESYDNNQACSPSFNAYLDDLVSYLVGQCGVINARIIEIGSGNGLFLRKLIESNAGNNGYGFDPSHSGPLEQCDGRIRFEKIYYGPECKELKADVVICRHVIEHVPDPVSFLTSIRKSLVNSPNARIFFETPCVEWILRSHVIWDFFYEHCSYFSASSASMAFELAGFEIKRIEHIFGGQYLWIEAQVCSTPSVPVSLESLSQLAAEFASVEKELIQMWRQKVLELKSEGGVALWGAAAKGVTLANLIDPKREFVDCLVDVNPNKQGRFIPGTGHSIISYRDLPAYDARNAILMNPNYRREILALLKEADMEIRLIESL